MNNKDFRIHPENSPNTKGEVAKSSCTNPCRECEKMLTCDDVCPIIKKKLQD